MSIQLPVGPVEGVLVNIACHRRRHQIVDVEPGSHAAPDLGRGNVEHRQRHHAVREAPDRRMHGRHHARTVGHRQHHATQKLLPALPGVQAGVLVGADDQEKYSVPGCAACSSRTVSSV
jgi:hypothetical protein